MISSRGLVTKCIENILLVSQYDMCLTIGTCMCVHCCSNHILAGFEDGSIVLFDHRKCEPVSELKVHSEPGTVLHTCVCVRLCVHACMHAACVQGFI